MPALYNEKEIFRFEKKRKSFFEYFWPIVQLNKGSEKCEYFNYFLFQFKPINYWIFVLNKQQQKFRYEIKAH